MTFAPPIFCNSAAWSILDPSRESCPPISRARAFFEVEEERATVRKPIWRQNWRAR